MHTSYFGQHIMLIAYFINKTELHLHFKEQKQKLLYKLTSIVGQFAHLLGDLGRGTAGSERPSTLLPAGGSLEQL